MLASSFVYRLGLIIAACLAWIEGSCLFAQNAELPKSIRLAHVRYADLAPLAVTWTQSTEVTPTGQPKIATDALDSIRSESSFVQQFAYRAGRMYMRRETKGSSSWPPRTDEFAFDQNLFYAAHNLFYAGDRGNHEPKDQPYLHKWLPKNDDPEASYFHNDYFRAAGIRLPTRTKELVSSCQPRSELLALLAEGGRVETVNPTLMDGRPLVCVQVAARGLQEEDSLSRRYDFYLDPKRGYAVCRLEIRDEASRLLFRSGCTEFEQLSGLWMPRLCRVEEYTFAERQDKQALNPEVFTSPFYVKRIRVNAFDSHPWPDDRFQLCATRPGVYVNDASFPEVCGKNGILYQIPADPRRLEEVIALRRAFYRAGISARERAPLLRASCLVLNGVALTGLAVYFFRRRKKASYT